MNRCFANLIRQFPLSAAPFRSKEISPPEDSLL